MGNEVLRRTSRICAFCHRDRTEGNELYPKDFWQLDWNQTQPIPQANLESTQLWHAQVTSVQAKHWRRGSSRRRTMKPTPVQARFSAISDLRGCSFEQNWTGNLNSFHVTTSRILKRTALKHRLNLPFLLENVQSQSCYRNCLEDASRNFASFWDWRCIGFSKYIVYPTIKA